MARSSSWCAWPRERRWSCIWGARTRSSSTSLPSLPTSSALEGVIVGLDETSGLGWFEDGRQEGNPLPGRYWLVTRAGVIAPFTVEPGATRVEVPLGEAELRVRTSKRFNVQAVPADADAFLRLMAARVWVKVDAESEARFRLQPGRYLLVGEAGVVLREVALPPDGLEVFLD